MSYKFVKSSVQSPKARLGIALLQAADAVVLNNDETPEGCCGAVLYFRRLVSAGFVSQIPGIENGFVDEYGEVQDFATDFYADLIGAHGLTYIDEHGRLALLDEERLRHMLINDPIRLQGLVENFMTEVLKYHNGPPMPQTH